MSCSSERTFGRRPSCRPSRAHAGRLEPRGRRRGSESSWSRQRCCGCRPRNWPGPGTRRPGAVHRRPPRRCIRRRRRPSPSGPDRTKPSDPANRLNMRLPAAAPSTKVVSTPAPWMVRLGVETVFPVEVKVPGPMSTVSVATDWSMAYWTVAQAETVQSPASVPPAATRRVAASAAAAPVTSTAMQATRASRNLPVVRPRVVGSLDTFVAEPETLIDW